MTDRDRQTDHLHRPLVRFEQLAGELAEDAQVGQIRRHGRFRRLAEVLEDKVRAVPAHIDNTHTHKFALNSSNKVVSMRWRRCDGSPVDQDDALAKLDQVPEREGEAPGKLFDAGQGLDAGPRPAVTVATVVAATAAFLPLPQTSKQLWAEQQERQIRRQPA